MDAGGLPLMTLLSQAGDALGRGWSTAWAGLWMGALAATLLAGLILGLARRPGLRPATRHALWLAVLASFLTPAVAASMWRPTWFASERWAPRAEGTETPRIALQPSGAVAPRGEVPSITPPPLSALHPSPMASSHLVSTIGGSTTGVSTIGGPDAGGSESRASAAGQNPSISPPLGTSDAASGPSLDASSHLAQAPRAGDSVASAAADSQSSGWSPAPARRSDGSPTGQDTACQAECHDTGSPIAAECSPTTAPNGEASGCTSNSSSPGSPSDCTSGDEAPSDGSSDTLAGPSCDATPLAGPSTHDHADPAGNDVPARDASQREAFDSLLAAVTTRVPDDTRLERDRIGAGQLGEVAPATLPADIPAEVLVPTPRSMQRWVARLVAVRDAVASLPPLPLSVWLLGAGFVLTTYVRRARQMRRVLRSAIPATASIEREVLEVARALGLEQAPRTLITRHTVSPLVWCGVQPVVVLPWDLWTSLDRAARRTILVHELAHVRRGDHRVAWMEAAVAVLYWWHPLAWWVRSRIHEAAEAACDTWVTALCPQNRRHYAEALVLASSFLSNTSEHARSRTLQAACGSVSVGFVTGRSRRLARRITMIMTSRFAPRMSHVGTAAVLLAVGMGAIVAPSLACPPSDCADQAAKEVQAAQAAAKAGNKARQRAMELATKARADADVARARAREAARATAPAAAAGSPFQGEAPAIDAMGQPISVAPSAAAGQRLDVFAQGQRAGTIPPADAARVIDAPGHQLYVFTAPSASAGGQPLAVAGQMSGEVQTQRYVLPEGKLEALVELMSREDVPVFIENQGDAILVYGNAQQQAAFAAFVHLIHPDAAGGNAGGMRYGQPLNPLGGLHTTSPARRGGRGAMGAADERAVSQLRAQLESSMRQRQDLELDANRIREKADETRSRADELREAFESLSEQRENMSRLGDETTSRALNEAMRSLEARAQAIEREAANMERQADSHERSMDAIERAIEQLEQRLESLSESLEDQGEELSDAADEPSDELAVVDGADDVGDVGDIGDIGDPADVAQTEDVAPVPPVSGTAAPAPAMPTPPMPALPPAVAPKSAPSSLPPTAPLPPAAPTTPSAPAAAKAPRSTTPIASR